MESRVYVDDEIFLGRFKEQEDFCSALETLSQPTEDRETPFVFLIYGEGGMGKSKLLRRFRDIAEREEPWEGKLYVLLLDWEIERNKQVGLQVARESINTDSVLATLYGKARDMGWHRHFRLYQDALKRRREVDIKFANAYSRDASESRYAGLLSLGAEVIAAQVRRLLGVSGDWQKRIATGTEGLFKGGEEAFAWFKARVKLHAEEEAVFRMPEEVLARALGSGFAAVSRDKPLVLLLDTYEIVAYRDVWIRSVIQAAGPQVMWVIAGRDNLRDSRPADRFVGYSAEFTRRLVPIDIQELAIDFLREYLLARAPERPMSHTEAAKIHHATQGIPLAMHQAGDLWALGVNLEAIAGDVPDRTDRDSIVRLMSQRVLIYCLGQSDADRADRRALYLLSMQRRPDREVQEAILRMPTGRFDHARVDELARRYSAVRLHGGLRLHDGVSAFLREHLLTNPDDDVHDLADQATVITSQRRAKCERNLPLLEQRCTDDDWLEVVLDNLHWHFWQDFDEAWSEFQGLVVVGLGYSRDLLRGLLEVAESFSFIFKDGLRKRLGILRRATQGEDDDALAALLTELVRQRSSWSTEQRAILDLHKGQLLYRAKRHHEALAAYASVEAGFPENGESLRQQLADRLYEVATALIWAGRESEPVRSLDIERCLRKVVTWKPSKAEAWNLLGAELYAAKSLKEAEDAFQQAIGLQSIPDYYHNLGVVYHDQARYKEAIESFQRAITMDSEYAHPHSGLGRTYEVLKRYDEAIASHERAIAIYPSFAYFHRVLGDLYAELERHDEAIESYRRATTLDDHYALAYSNLGVMYGQIKKYDEAIENCRRAAVLEPTNPTFYNAIGNSLAAAGCHDDAIESYRRAVALDPSWAVVRGNLAASFAALKRYDEAIESYKQTIALDPATIDHRMELAYIYHSRKQYHEAIDCYRSAIAIDSSISELYSSLGVIYIDLGRPDDAIESLRYAIKLNPKNASAWNSIGYLYADLGRYDDAMSALKTAVEADAKFPNPLKHLAKINAANGFFQEAIEFLLNACEIDSHYASVYASLAACCRQLGKLDLYSVYIAKAAESIAEEDEYNQACFAAIVGNFEEALALLRQAPPGYRRSARRDPDFTSIRADLRFKELVELT